MAEARRNHAQILAVMLVAASFGLLAAMPVWRWVGQPSGIEMDAPVSADVFQAKLDAMVEAHATGEEQNGAPVVAPPPGDVYILARRWQFYPALQLQAGETYRLHVLSDDIPHGFALAGEDAMLIPGLMHSRDFTPRQEGRLALQCSEFCGTDHNRMKAYIDVTAASADK